MRLFIILTDFNGFAQTRRCLQALRASHHQGFSTLVVDHGNSRETRDALASEFPEVIRLAGSPDIWWTGAINLGIRFALGQGAERIILLNNDSYLLPETIGTLLDLSVKCPEAIIAPIQRNWRTGQITAISSRSRFLLGFPTVPVSKRLTPALSAKELLPVKLIIGGRGVILPAKVFERLGLFDAQELPHYGADHDFYLRARLHSVPLYVATRAFIDIDETRTTSANRPETLSWRAFLYTLRDTRSHRNLRHITALFRKHYPIPGLYPLGVMLYMGRYLLVYLIKRAGFMMRIARRECG